MSRIFTKTLQSRRLLSYPTPPPAPSCSAHNLDEANGVSSHPASRTVLISLDEGDGLDNIRSASGFLSRFQIISLSDFPRMSRAFIDRSLKK